MNFFVSYIKRKNAYYKAYYYQNNFIQYNFQERYKQICELQKIKTSTSIIFKGKVPFNTSIKEVQQILGKIHFIHEHEYINLYKTVYYKNKIKEVKNKSQLHFYDNQFFYGIQIFPYLNNIQLQEFINLLRIKYQFSSGSNLPILISDPNNNVLCISYNIGLVLEYITSNTTLITSVLEAFDNLQLQIAMKDLKRRQLILDNL